MPFAVDLPTPTDQIDRLDALGLLERAGVEADRLRAAASAAAPGLVVLTGVAPSDLVGHLRHADKAGFVVPDMTDVDLFTPLPGLDHPAGPVHLLADPDRGDHLANWSPDEAMPELLAAGRTPMTLVEGLHWLIQQPVALERNHCFMTIGSRLRRANGSLDARTPALWISNGTGRDGADRRHAPKLGWCWAGNRHTWLGFGSGSQRTPLPV